MNYNELDESVEEFLSSVHGHLLALQEHHCWYEEPIAEIEEHLDTIFEDLPIKIEKKKTKKLLCYLTEVDAESIEVHLHIQKEKLSSYYVKGIDMPYYFKDESWWKEV
jgi:hypothetical protein